MILGISGSTNPNSTNTALLHAIEKTFQVDLIVPDNSLHDLPLYHVEADQSNLSPIVVEWRQMVKEAKALLISTPAYLDNIPAALKNALEWLKTSGELSTKPTVLMSYTPHTPRGKNVCQSVLWTLNALEARVLVHFELHQSDLNLNSNGIIQPCHGFDMIKEALAIIEAGV